MSAASFVVSSLSWGISVIVPLGHVAYHGLERGERGGQDLDLDPVRHEGRRVRDYAHLGVGRP